jgi:hypothetical protein
VELCLRGDAHAIAWFAARFQPQPAPSRARRRSKTKKTAPKGGLRRSKHAGVRGLGAVSSLGPSLACLRLSGCRGANGFVPLICPGRCQNRIQRSIRRRSRHRPRMCDSGVPKRGPHCTTAGPFAATRRRPPARAIPRAQKPLPPRAAPRLPTACAPSRCGGGGAGVCPEPAAAPRQMAAAAAGRRREPRPPCPPPRWRLRLCQPPTRTHGALASTRVRRCWSSSTERATPSSRLL